MTESISAASETVSDAYKDTISDESWWKGATSDWRETTMGVAVTFQVVHIAYNFFQASFTFFFTQMGVLGGLLLGGYYVNLCKYMQSFEKSAKQLEASNLELKEKLARLEAAAATLIETVAKFDSNTADYLKSMTLQSSELQDSVARLTHTVDAFARVFESQSLSQLWRETLEAVKAFQEAKAEYDQIRIAITTERAALECLYADLQGTQQALSSQVNALGGNEQQLSQLYQKYLDFLEEITQKRSLYDTSNNRACPSSAAS